MLEAEVTDQYRSGRNDNEAITMPLQKHSLGGCTIDMPPLNCR